MFNLCYDFTIYIKKMYEISKSGITIEKKNMPVHKRRRATEHVNQ